MKFLLALAAGYVLGARTGGEDFEDVLQSARAIKDSEEFRDFLGSIRLHASHTLREVAAMLERADGDGELPDANGDLVDRVRHLAGLR